GRISLSTNCRTASRIIFSSSGHSYMRQSVRDRRPARRDRGFSRAGRTPMLLARNDGSFGGGGMEPSSISVERTLPIDAALIDGVILRLRRDAPGAALRWTLGEIGAVEIDVAFTSNGPAWTTSARIWERNGLAVANVALRLAVGGDDTV